LHIGHLHPNNTFKERIDIWHASAALVYKVSCLKLVVDSGFDTNTDRAPRSPIRCSWSPASSDRRARIWTSTSVCAGWRPA